MLDKLAVLLIDMQESFLRKLKRGEEEKIIPCQLEIIQDFCVKGNIPLIVLEYKGDGMTTDILRNKFPKVPKLKIITKSCNDGFTRTDLLSHLKALKVDTLLLMGINADYCVKSTAESAVRHGYEIVTSEKLIAGRFNQSDDKSGGWYAKNGSFYADMDTLLKKITA